jgi:hypothetical protein
MLPASSVNNRRKVLVSKTLVSETEGSKPPKPFATLLLCWLKTLLKIIVSTFALLDGN